MEEQKDEMTQHVEAQLGDGKATEVSEARQRQGITPHMILLSCYVALAGWIFNFDLGEEAILL